MIHTEAFMNNTRCRLPLLEICPTAKYIRIDIGMCNCAVPLEHIILRHSGCVEMEEICEEQTTCCKSVSNGCCGTVKLNLPPRKVLRPKPQPILIYPLFKIDPNDGHLLYHLDDKLLQTGWNRVLVSGAIMNGTEIVQETPLFEAVITGETPHLLEVDTYGVRYTDGGCNV